MSQFSNYIDSIRTTKATAPEPCTNKTGITLAYVDLSTGHVHLNQVGISNEEDAKRLRDWLLELLK